MATAFTHAFVAVAAGAACFGVRVPARFWLLAPACSALPDLDVGLHAYGVEYGDPWGHRGMTHSILFALLLSVAVVSGCFRHHAPFLSRAWWQLWAFFFLITASHGFIDAFTDGGLGIAFFSPFDTGRYFMPWHPLAVPDFGLANLFTAYGLEVILSELLWVWAPVAALAGPIVIARLCLARSERRLGADRTDP